MEAKAKIGRPKALNPRRKYTKVMLTMDEVAMLKSKALDKGLTVSELIRSAVLK